MQLTETRSRLDWKLGDNYLQICLLLITGPLQGSSLETTVLNSKWLSHKIFQSWYHTTLVTSSVPSYAHAFHDGESGEYWTIASGLVMSILDFQKAKANDSAHVPLTLYAKSRKPNLAITFLKILPWTMRTIEAWRKWLCDTAEERPSRGAPKKLRTHKLLYLVIDWVGACITSQLSRFPCFSIFHNRSFIELLWSDDYLMHSGSSTIVHVEGRQ